MAIQSVTVTFNGTQDTLPATWTAVTSSQGVQCGVTVTDAAGPVVAWLTARTTTGCTVNVSERFSGTVEITIEDL